MECSTRVTLVVSALLACLSSSTAFSQEVTTLAPPQRTEFSGDLAVDANGDIFAANFGTSLATTANGARIWKITPDGVYSEFASGFNGASGNTFDAQGNLFQSNIAANRIDKVTPDGVRSVFAIGSPISNPVGLAHDSAGNLYVSNCGNSTIGKFTPDGQGSVFSSTPLISCPNGLTIDDEDTLYAANFNNGNIIRISQTGAASILASTPASASKPNGGNGHIIFRNNRLYVVSNASHQVFELSLDGQLTLIAGSGIRGRTDGPLLQARFSLPNGIDLSPDGTVLYVNDSEGLVNNNDIAPNVIRVIPLTNIDPEFQINAGLNDAWFNQATAGQGFLMTVFPDIRKMFLAWFTFDTQRPDPSVVANLGEPGHRWLTAFGSYEGDTATLVVDIASGGIFDAAEPAPTHQEDGTIVIEFADCENGLLTYNIPSIAQSGAIPLSRIALDNVAGCEALASAP